VQLRHPGDKNDEQVSFHWWGCVYKLNAVYPESAWFQPLSLSTSEKCMPGLSGLYLG
jgi:hypothetical protein